MNPRQRIGHALEEVFTMHTDMSAKEKREAVISLLEEVGLKEDHFYKYPHEFSGGNVNG